MRISDWSSDVCSSDLGGVEGLLVAAGEDRVGDVFGGGVVGEVGAEVVAVAGLSADCDQEFAAGHCLLLGWWRPRRSEERRVGDGCGSTCRSRGSPDH